ncbi:carboxypeptidase B-like [Chrysoperla carnea]|uniref:carboxypeptidase B-like n=1 Tax=Chrysoperla carnea TaxID=189513 RepID=UPI001D071D6B|nr:carboxypeptidase B-like [Chrysoperla carnea]
MIRRCILVFSELVACNFTNETNRESRHFIGNYDYTGYSVFEIYPKNSHHLKVIQDLRLVFGLDIWSMVNKIEAPTTVMVPPDRYINFVNLLEANTIPYRTIIQDVQKKIDRERYVQLNNPNIVSVVSPTGVENSYALSFYKYHQTRTIEQYLKYLQHKYPNRIQLINIGKSYEGRNLHVAKISFNKYRSGSEIVRKPAILIDGGTHAREWISVATVVYLIYALVENYRENIDLLKDIDWYLMPCLNPDGYEYSHTDRRLWRKTRSKTPKPYCRGIDLNRNYDFHWQEHDDWGTKNPCSVTYGGESSFSEPESKAYSDFARSIRKSLKLYITFHSYGPFVLYPWGYTWDLPENRDELHRLGVKFSQASDYFYEVGNSSRLLYPASGTSDDWFKGALGVKLSYTIELPGGGSEGFDLPQNEIHNVAEDVLNGMRVFAKYIRDKYVI